MTNSFTLTLELANNNRVTHGLDNLGDEFYTSDWGYAERPGGFIEVTLQGLDFGRYDSEGDSYIAETLNIVQGDILVSYIEEVF